MSSTPKASKRADSVLTERKNGQREDMETERVDVMKLWPSEKIADAKTERVDVMKLMS